MRTLLPDPPPADFQALLERRRRLGFDTYDEVWDGVLHMTPARSGQHAILGQQLSLLLDTPARAAGLEPTMQPFNLGNSEQDFRVPDGGLHRGLPLGTWHPTAALAVEILSPGDESWEKLSFYAAHHVDEILIVDPQAHSVQWLALEEGEYRPVERSRLIDLGPDELGQRIDWPPASG